MTHTPFTTEVTNQLEELCNITQGEEWIELEAFGIKHMVNSLEVRDEAYGTFNAHCIEIPSAEESILVLDQLHAQQVSRTLHQKLTAARFNR